MRNEKKGYHLYPPTSVPYSIFMSQIELMLSIVCSLRWNYFVEFSLAVVSYREYEWDLVPFCVHTRVVRIGNVFHLPKMRRMDKEEIN